MAKFETDSRVIDFQEDLEHVDSLVEDSYRLLDSVYTMLKTPPKRRPSLTSPTSPNSSIGNNSRNISISASPQIPSPSSGLLSDSGALASMSFSPSALDLEREISRISRFCEKIEQDLSGTVSMGNTSPRSSRTPLPRTPTVQSTNNTDEDVLVLIKSAPNGNDIPDVGRLRPSNRSHQSTPTPEPAAFIDLSNIECFSPVSSPRHNNRTSQRNRNDDDSVVIITPLIEATDDIVDLCTPTLQRTISRRHGFSNGQANGTRRRLLGSQSAGNVGTNHSSIRRARFSSDQISRRNKKTSPSNGAQADLNISDGLSCSERTPFMCAVCMESCINHLPTSTKCGHVFCKRCIDEAVRLTKKCPMCNTKLTSRMLFRIYV